jgi:hypothetical protein
MFVVCQSAAYGGLQVRLSGICHAFEGAGQDEKQAFVMLVTNWRKKYFKMLMHRIFG